MSSVSCWLVGCNLQVPTCNLKALQHKYRQRGCGAMSVIYRAVYACDVMLHAS